jgi:hypothetical protein
MNVSNSIVTQFFKKIATQLQQNFDVVKKYKESIDEKGL